MSRCSRRARPAEGRPRRGREAAPAFTLIEVCIACLLILLAIVPLVAMMIQGHRGTAFSIHQSQASNIALELIEGIDALPYDDVTEPKLDALAESIHSASAMSPVFVRSIEISEAKEHRVTALVAGATKQLNHFLWYKIVKIKVEWADENGELRQMQFSTVSSKIDFDP